MADLNSTIRALMRRVREQGALPSSRSVVDEAFERLGYGTGAFPPEDILTGFNQYLRNVWEETLAVLEDHEQRVYSEAIPRELAATYPDEVNLADRTARQRGFVEGFAALFTALYPALRQCFLSISQSRKTRGGKDFELQVEHLLELASVPFEAQEAQYRTDLMLPNRVAFDREPNTAAVVSVKRTLRERWREVAEELYNLRAPNVFLFTADEDVSAGHANRICNDYRIYLVVWDSVKMRFPDQPMVLSYSEWATRRLPGLMQQWR